MTAWCILKLWLEKTLDVLGSCEYGILHKKLQAAEKAGFAVW